MADGILHAYIDGALDALRDAGELPDGMSSADVVAHLNTCADCRARLDAEREVRQRAGLVLRDAAPARIDTPPFAVVQGVNRRRFRTLPLAWAASMLLAVGAGWWGSEIWRSGPAIQSETMRTAAPDAGGVDGAAAGAEALERPAAPGSVTTPPRTASTRDTPPAPTVEIAPPAAAERRADDVAVSAARDTDSATAGRTEPIGIARAETAAAQTQPLALAPPPPAPAPPPARDMEQMRLRRMQPQAAPQTFIESAAAAGAIAPFITPGPEMLEFQANLSREQGNANVWRDWRPADSASVAGQIFVISGAAEPHIEVAPWIGHTLVRVTQMLPTGEAVELITWRVRALALEPVVITGRADAEPATEAAAKAVQNAVIRTAADSRVLDDGRRELVLHDPGTATWIALRADVPEARLRALAAEVARGAAPRAR